MSEEEKKGETARSNESFSGLDKLNPDTVWKSLAGLSGLHPDKNTMAANTTSKPVADNSTEGEKEK
ncbi:MAG: hypothetical protein M0Z75_04105 [Nitrospiraceae bacterium]|nr:hypothetical protein [Nitrospiraceae bacterium]